MKNPSSHNKLFPALSTDVGPSNIRTDWSEIRCSGKGCQNMGSNNLKIKYINKSGYFCNKCTKELLKEGLAIRAGSVSNE